MTVFSVYNLNIDISATDCMQHCTDYSSVYVFQTSQPLQAGIGLEIQNLFHICRDAKIISRPLCCGLDTWCWDLTPENQFLWELLEVVFNS